MRQPLRRRLPRRPRDGAGRARDPTRFGAIRVHHEEARTERSRPGERNAAVWRPGWRDGGADGRQGCEAGQLCPIEVDEMEEMDRADRVASGGVRRRNYVLALKQDAATV